MSFPRINIECQKIKNNLEIILKNCKKNNIKVTGITKSFCGEKELAEIFVSSGIDYLGDSRMENLEKLKEFNIPKVLIRIPMKSEAKKVVRLADISLNSEMVTIRELNKAAAEIGVVHKIVLMLELGDLREGILPSNILESVKEIISLKNIYIIGFGVNLTCYGGVIPDPKNLGKLVNIAKYVERETGIKIDVVSGGNSSSYYLLENNQLPKGITNLRIGEAILLGRETAYGNRIKNTYDDAFILDAEIVELKRKPSIPEGEIGMDAFGEKPHFEDKGVIQRAILAIGKQDTDITSMTPLDEKISILGASSDHLILDVTNSKKNYQVGDIISFNVRYSALLKLMTSNYVHKNYF